MAIVKGILVNDGGAPARIMNYMANTAISAGDAVGLVHVASGAAKAVPLDSDDASGVFIGAALTDASADGECSVISGRGVQVNMNCADLNGGVALMADGTTAGKLITFADGGSPVNTAPVAVTLEDNSAAGLTKCLIL